MLDEGQRTIECNETKRMNTLCISAYSFLYFNPLNAKLNPICHLLALLGGATIVVVSGLRVKMVKKSCNMGSMLIFIRIVSFKLCFFL
jgi:hypothetical protein